MRRVASVVVLTLLLTATLLLVFKIQLVKTELAASTAPAEEELEPITQSPINIAYVHGFVYYDGYLYLASVTSPAKLAKVKPNNYSDVTIKTITRNGANASRLYDIIAESGYLWTIDSGGYLYKLNSSNMDTTEYSQLFPEAGQALYSDGIYIYATGAGGWVAKYRISDGDRSNNNVSAAGLLHSAVVDGSWLWAFDNSQRSLYKINKTSLQLSDEKNIGYIVTDDIAQDDNYIYLPVENSIGRIVRVQKSDLSTYIETPTGMGYSYGAFIVEDGSAEYLLYLDKDNNKIWVFTVPSLRNLRVISLVNLTVAGGINELALENNYLHITQWKDSPINLLKVSKFSVLGIDWNPADINHDLKVDIYDVVLACNAYSSTPSDPNWNGHCDIADPYGVIDIFDIVMIRSSYGEEY